MKRDSHAYALRALGYSVIGERSETPRPAQLSRIPDLAQYKHDTKRGDIPDNPKCIAWGSPENAVRTCTFGHLAKTLEVAPRRPGHVPVRVS